VRAVMMAKTAAVIATLKVSVRFIRSPTTAPLEHQKADPLVPKIKSTKRPTLLRTYLRVAKTSGPCRDDKLSSRIISVVICFT
jgi:hypothetical protein